jgi:hypothetical protein
MPSGLATTASAAVICDRRNLASFTPRHVALRRSHSLYARRHQRAPLSDVVACALAGIIGAFLVQHFFAEQRLLFGARLAAYPWPSFKQIKAAARHVVIRA